MAFFHSTSLRPASAGDSKRKDVRYLDIHEDERLDEALVASYINRASELRGWVLQCRPEVCGGSVRDGKRRESGGRSN